MTRDSKQTISSLISSVSRPKNRAKTLNPLSRSTGHQSVPNHLPQLQLDLAQLQVAALHCRTTGNDGGSRFVLKTRFSSKLDNSCFRSPILTKIHPRAHLNLQKLPEVSFHGGTTCGGGWKPNPIKKKIETELSTRISRVTDHLFL